VGRIIPFNHPFMFVAGKSAAPLAAGNTIVVKPPEQAPLSSLRLAELIDGILPPGVWNLVPGGKEVGQVLASHPDVAKVALIAGGKSPSDPNLAKGFYVEPTVFADVTMDMRIGKEEIFGPVLSIFKWRAEDELLAQVNQVEYGLTCSIWTNDLATAHRVAAAVEAGYVWINEVSKHFLGAPFGGYKQSGVGREEGIEELLSFTREKNIHINLKRRVGAH